jgi:hypothetical protein
VSKTAIPIKNPIMAKKYEFPYRRCSGDSDSSRLFPYGTRQMGAVQKSIAVRMAHTHPSLGRSIPRRSQAITGTTQTRWWLQVTGETSSPVTAQTSMAKKGDETR